MKSPSRTWRPKPLSGLFFKPYYCPFQRVHLDINVGEHAINYADVAQKEKLSELQLRVRQLLDQVEQITKEQNYQRVSGLFIKGSSILFNHFIDMRTTVNLSISCL